MDPVQLAAAPKLPPDIVYPHDNGNAAALPVGAPDYAWHILAEGDSWFTIGALPSSNLLFELRLARWTQILNLAYPGDTIVGAGTLAKNKDLASYLAKKNFATPFQALLLSGGGNDVIDAAPKLILPAAPKGSDPDDPASYLDAAALAPLLGNIQAAFATIVSLRDSKSSLSRNAPAFVHTYDYATPRNAPARFLGGLKLKGPWLFKAFAGSKADVVMQQKIADRLIDRLADALWALDSSSGKPQSLPNFHVIDTRNTLVPANPSELGSSNDWLNEIHPTHDGYRKIAARISPQINALLP